MLHRRMLIIPAKVLAYITQESPVKANKYPKSVFYIQWHNSFSSKQVIFNISKKCSKAKGLETLVMYMTPCVWACPNQQHCEQHIATSLENKFYDYCGRN